MEIVIFTSGPRVYSQNEVEMPNEDGNRVFRCAEFNGDTYTLGLD
jgi:hypothetical protein